MEITHRKDIGANLHAPKLDKGQWSYDLVSQVQLGDRVLHWSGTTRTLVGWSEVTGPATTVPKYTWQPRGGPPRLPAVAPGHTITDLAAGPRLVSVDSVQWRLPGRPRRLRLRARSAHRSGQG